MTFKNRVSNFFNKSENFKYLDKLINSGKKVIDLDADICLDSSEAQIYAEGINITNDGIVIDGNGHTIDDNGETRIFNIKNKSVTFKNINFKNGSTNSNKGGIEGFFEVMYGGGAMHALESILTFENCSFKNCSSTRGGAVSLSYCQAKMENCNFEKNTASEWAGAIFDDDDSSLKIFNSVFKENVAGSEANAVRATESSLVIVGCEFFDTGNKSTLLANGGGNVVLKDSTFNDSKITLDNMSVIKNCDFKDSQVNGTYGDVYIPKDESYDFNLSSDKLHYLNSDMDWVRELTQHELAREFLKYFPKFNDAEFSEQDRLHDEMIEFVEIWRKICSYESNFVMADVIVNILNLTEEDFKDIGLNRITKEGANDKSSYDQLHAILDEVLEFNNFPITFADFADLIDSKNEITLMSDVCLDDNEIDDYIDGIKISEDDLTIDGNGHVIDAKNKTSIFRIEAKNILIKDLTFKNASSHMGGAISNIGDVRFENCKFLDNGASELGGAIVNDEKMILNNCEFLNNSSGGVGGAIAATFASVLEIKNTKFSKNSVSLDIECPAEVLTSETMGFGGAIYNNGKLDISDSEFIENACDVSGGVMIVLPDSKIAIDNTLFKQNAAKVDGGVIHTMGEIEIDACEFIENHADESGGVFDTAKSSKIKIKNSQFENNTANNANVIVNRGKLELIETTIDEEDILDDRQEALPGGDETTETKSDEDASGDEFPEDYDDYAKRFKELFEEMLEEEDHKPKLLLISLLFAVWAEKFPKDANLIGAALLMASMLDDDLVRTILQDYDHEEYRKRLTDYDAIDEELSSWFMAMALIGMIFNDSEDENSSDNMTSKEYAQKYLELVGDFKDVNENEQEDAYDEIKELVNNWKEDYPEDLNMSLAYLTVNVPYLSKEKIIEVLDNLEGHSAGDESSYNALYESCKNVLVFRDIDLKDYLEE